MEAAVAGEKGTAVNDFYGAVREGLLELPGRFFVQRGTGPRHEHGTVHNQKVGIGSRQAVIVQIQRLRKGQGNEPVGFSIQRAEGAQLLLHGLEGRIILVGGVLAGGVGNGVRAAETGQDVHVAVGIVTGNAAMVQPQDALQAKGLFELFFNFLAAQVLVAVQ